MKFNFLPDTDVKVSKICLGTMTWGRQNNEADAHAQMDFALDQGVNFFDTAELYPIPPRKDEQGDTEEHIGNWFKARNNRDKIILASKVAGRSGLNYMREDKELTRLSKEHIHYAVDKSLQRLQTDYIDLYQVHWPDRPFGAFSGKLEYKYNPIPEDTIEIEVTLEALGELVKAGKIRHIGLSNETPWGTMKYLELSKTHSLPRVVSIQNAYNLVNRAFEVGLSEITNHEDVGLLSYSPLGQGILTGKYLNNKIPKNSRIGLFGDFWTRYKEDNAKKAVDDYYKLATENGLTLTQMSLAFVNSRPFMTSNIIGATTMEQLKENIGTADIELSDEIIAKINLIHSNNPNPTP